jgi:hypothetical protein
VSILHQATTCPGLKASHHTTNLALRLLGALHDWASPDCARPTTSLREAEKSTTSGMTSRVTSRAMCRGTRTRGGGEVVDDEPARGGVVNDEPARGRVVDDEPARGGEVDDERHDEPRDETRDVPKQSEARRRKIDSALTRARRLASMDLDESTSRLILLMRVL